nr:hypothetical protein [Escherichia coli]
MDGRGHWRCNRCSARVLLSRR